MTLSDLQGKSQVYMFHLLVEFVFLPFNDHSFLILKLDVKLSARFVYAAIYSVYCCCCLDDY